MFGKGVQSSLETTKGEMAAVSLQEEQVNDVMNEVMQRVISDLNLDDDDDFDGEFPGNEGEDSWQAIVEEDTKNDDVANFGLKRESRHGVRVADLAKEAETQAFQQYMGKSMALLDAEEARGRPRYNAMKLFNAVVAYVVHSLQPLQVDYNKREHLITRMQTLLTEVLSKPLGIWRAGLR